MAKLYSRYLDRDIEVPDSSVVSGGEVVTLIPHDVLEELIYNSEEASENNFQVHYTPVVTELRHYAFLCCIADKYGRRIQGVGESLDATLETPIALNYPTLMAVKRAFDDAAIKFLGLPGKVYSDQQVLSGDSSAPHDAPTQDVQTPAEKKPARKSVKKDVSVPAPEPEREPAPESAPSDVNRDASSAPAADEGELALDVEHDPGVSVEDGAPTALGNEAAVDESGDSANPAPEVAPSAEAAPPAQTGAAPAANEPDEFDTTIVDVGSTKRLGLSIRECYAQHKDSVEWVANTMLAQSDNRKRLKELCKTFLQRVADGLES